MMVGVPGLIEAASVQDDDRCRFISWRRQRR